MAGGYVARTFFVTIIFDLLVAEFSKSARANPFDRYSGSSVSSSSPSLSTRVPRCSHNRHGLPYPLPKVRTSQRLLSTPPILKRPPRPDVRSRHSDLLYLHSCTLYARDSAKSNDTPHGCKWERGRMPEPGSLLTFTRPFEEGDDSA